ncbi:MAG: restriction endonuclease [Planctomycetaceae bacterium]|nr:restriction endonuclease [Planctomycetaceae bacterium]
MQNQLFYGDNLEVLQRYIEDDTVDLCYVDPPFNSNRNYNQIYNRINEEDDFAQSQAFVDTWNWGIQAEEYLQLLKIEARYSRRVVDTILGFEKILGKGALLSYLVNMTIRFVEIHRVLKPTGCFYVHCDSTLSHYLRIILDGIFVDTGGRFCNEIIWFYKKWASAQKVFVRNHDTIFRFSKSGQFTHNLLYSERAESTKRRFGSKKIQSGELDKSGKRIPSVTLEEDSVGVKMGDVWEIPIIAPSAKERLGYPTQKPLALLERIIKASSNEGDIVLDAFCGCGTAIDAAHSLGRNWIGIDITYNSISLVLKRLKVRYGEDIEKELTLSGIPQDIESAAALAHKKDDRLRKEFEKWTILTYSNNYAKINDKKGSDKGIDGVAYIVGNQTALFSVKSGSVSVKDIRDFKSVLEREKAAAGIFITLEEPTKPMLKEAALLGNLLDPPGLKLPTAIPKLQIVTVQELMNGARMTLPLPDAVVKSASGIKKKKHNNLEI